jgi:high-affinity iron transporter
MRNALATALVALAVWLPASAQTRLAPADTTAPMIVHLLDYVGVDYGRAVEGGKVKSEDEYKEMVEFTARAAQGIRALPANPRQAALVADAVSLSELVAGKAGAAAVAEASAALRRGLIGAYKLQVAPRAAPPLAAAPALYASHCAACHGAGGAGDGPAARGLDPAPASFHDAARMASRGVYGLYSTITLGVEGTSMAAFPQLSEADRWALAFFVANLGVPRERVEEGAALWRKGGARGAFSDLASLVAPSRNEVISRHGEDAGQVQDYLRAHPEALAEGRPGPIAFAQARLAEMLAAYERGDRAGAQQLAVTAYLDGFELAESSLSAVDLDLRLEIEREMLALRGALGAGAAPQAVREQTARIDALLAAASGKLTGEQLSETGAYVSSLIILLREGLEAILVLAAIIAFVAKTGRRDAMAWVHAGWAGALALGALTWVAATFLIDVSGANRELTSGITALLASAMLLYVGYWLHGRTRAQAWSRFLRDQVNAALGKKTLWAMASVSFLAVYRELFEVVLFYQALWVQAGEGGHHAILAGVLTAGIVLAVVGWGIFKYSLRLPLGPFFSTMTALLVLLAVVFAGQGIAALQEAGAVSVHAVPFFTVSMLGIHPTAETLLAQLAVLAMVLLGYWASGGRGRLSGAKS